MSFEESIPVEILNAIKENRRASVEEQSQRLDELREILENQDISILFNLLIQQYQTTEIDSDEIFDLISEVLDDSIEPKDLLDWLENFQLAESLANKEEITRYLICKYREMIFNYINDIAPDEVDLRAFELGFLDQQDLEIIFDDIKEGYWGEYLEELGNTGVLDLFGRPKIIYSDGRFMDAQAGVYFRPSPSEIFLTRSDGFRTRLFIGEADFSFSQAFIKKHPELSRSVIATELRSKESLRIDYPETFETHRKYLKKQGVKILYEIDGTKLHENERWSGQRISRIHFNFPHDGSPFKARTLPLLIKRFFRSASMLQGLEDRIYIALPQPPTTGKGNRYFYQGYVYDIYDAAAKSGYRCIKKRKFQSGEEKRYPGYFHRKTKKESSAEIVEESREYIFEKTGLSYRQISGSFPPKPFKVYGRQTKCLTEIETDPESSDYSDSDRESFTEVIETKIRGLSLRED
ncbi:MAG: DUF2431 domain-containing protein [Gammaproteobacteria bacterium]|nr:DUF2431 domain-containing protein [Gammaproteobacteria bacterium]